VKRFSRYATDSFSPPTTLVPDIAQKRTLREFSGVDVEGPKIRSFAIIRNQSIDRFRFNGSIYNPRDEYSSRPRPFIIVEIREIQGFSCYVFPLRFRCNLLIALRITQMDTVFSYQRAKPY
jgi:hypothetical protein